MTPIKTVLGARQITERTLLNTMKVFFQMIWPLLWEGIETELRKKTESIFFCFYLVTCHWYIKMIDRIRNTINLQEIKLEKIQQQKKKRW